MIERFVELAGGPVPIGMPLEDFLNLAHCRDVFLFFLFVLFFLFFLSSSLIFLVWRTKLLGLPLRRPLGHVVHLPIM